MVPSVNSSKYSDSYERWGIPRWAGVLKSTFLSFVAFYWPNLSSGKRSEWELTWFEHL